MHLLLESKGIVFEYKPVIQTKRIGEKIIEETKTEERSLETAIIKDGKRVFAERLVPTLQLDEFENFKLIFEKINEIAEALQNLG